MSLIKSISGIRGTIGGAVGENLTPLDVVRFSSAYGSWLKKRNQIMEKLTVVIGRDARISGAMVSNLVSSTLIGMGINVIDLGLSTTPTVEVAVPKEKAQGGIIITASHNPKEWNALKLLNEQGEFLDDVQGQIILDLATNDLYSYASINELGNLSNQNYLQKHLNAVLELDLVNVEVIKKAHFRVVVDAVNSTGGVFVPALLESLGVECIKLYCDPTGHFPHNPEPIKEHLTAISQAVVKHKADLGIVVDPDVDRLAFVNEDGSMFGEEYTLVAVADYVLSQMGGGNTSSNLSSTRALKDITKKHGGSYEASAVGEVNVVKTMKENQSIIGGEGNGGIIYPASHYGRDALVGIALFLSHLAQKGVSCKELRKSYPNYFMSKQKISLTPELDTNKVLSKITTTRPSDALGINTIDGIKIDFESAWVHLRKSNTEPIIRIYTEAMTQKDADELASSFVKKIKSIAIK